MRPRRARRIARLYGGAELCGFFHPGKFNEMTDITVQQFQEMTDVEMIAHLRKFRYKSQYKNPDAYSHAEYRIALMQGAKYMQTGNLTAFTSSPA